MAEYYPLLSKAVSRLRDGPPDKRQAIYDRARQALIGQLRSMEQANPDLIDRETRALDDAIAQLEAEIGPTPPPEATIEAPLPAAPATVLAEPPKRPALPPRPAGPPSPVNRDRASPPRPFALPPRPSTSPRPTPPTGPAIEPAAPLLRATRGSDERSPSPIMPVAPRLQVKAMDPDGPPPPGEPDAGSDVADRPGLPLPHREDVVRPVAPRQPVVKERFTARGLIVAVVAALVVAGIAYAAWRLRDKPEALARARAALQAAHQSDALPGKVSNRADGGAAPPTIEADRPSSGEAPSSPAPDPIPAAEPVAAGPSPSDKQASATNTAAEPTAPPSTVPEPTNAPPPSAVSDAPASGPSTQTVAVSQRAAFLVDGADGDDKIKTYVGTVVWTTESVSPGQGQPLATAVRAEVDVPDADVKLNMLIQKNVEAQFPASHTIELRFTLTPGNTLGNVKEISVPQLRKDDAPNGDPLAGLPVTITENYFLVGLTRGDLVARNLDLLQSRNWVDVPCRLASGKVAKITFEKGTAGDKILADAVQSWQ